ncbi:MAG: apolipoprotein N-acyltransferase [Spirochaetia bacterium]
MKKSIGRLVLGIILSAFSAGMLVFAFPPFNMWPLVWFCFVPFLIAQYRVMPPKLSSVAGAVFNGLWVWGYLGPVFGGSGNFMEYLPVIIAAASLVFDMGSRRFHNKTGYKWFVLQGVAAWVGIEMVRIFIPIAGTWGFIAYTLHSQPWLIQPAGIFGIFGVSALVLLVNYALGLTAIYVLDRFKRVAAIQPADSPLIAANQNREDLVAEVHRFLVEETRAAARQGAEVIVWPEGALQYDPEDDDPLDLTGLAQETDAYLVIGYVVPRDRNFRNEATVISPEGEFLGVFGKDHPVVFGGETSPTRGTYPVYETPIGVLGTIICYDLDFTDTARRLARQGAQLIAVPSNDWSGITFKHYTHVVFRAIENNTAMVKADAGFNSAVIDPQGRVVSLATTPQGGEATLVADVPVGTGNTISVLLGDWFGWLCLAAMVFFVIAEKWLIKRASPPIVQKDE